MSCADRRLSRAMRYVLSDLSKRHPLAKVASIAGLERTYFCKLFQQSVGLTFSSWDRFVRMEYAKELLAKGDLPITTISIDVGYTDVTTFERNFRRFVGRSPSRYRRQIRWADRMRNITIFADNSTTNAETPTNAGNSV